MNALLHSDRAPSGRCLLLAKALADVSTFSGKQCLDIATRLYDRQFAASSPVVVSLREGAEVSQLEEICRDSGIILQIAN